MGRIGSLPSVPEEHIKDVASTSWSLANTNRDPTLVVRARPGQLATDCPSCKSRLIVDVIDLSPDDAASTVRRSLQAPVSSMVRYATSVAAQTPLVVAAELLIWAPRRLLAVVDPAHRPLGVVTPTHILNAVKGHTRNELSQITAVEASTSGGPLLPGNARLEAAARCLVRDDRDFALVVDDGGRLLGVLLATDVLAALP